MILRQSLVLLARSALVGLTAMAVTTCGTREPTTDVERLARGRELVQKMDARLAAATDLSVETTETRDLVTRSGAKERVSLTGVYTVKRPDRFHTKVVGDRGVESWYDGKKIVVAIEKHKVFAEAAMPETIDRTLDALAERYDMALPLADLFYSSPAKALLSDAATGGYAGTENVGATPCYHLAFKDVGVEWDVWLPTEGEPLPKRFRTVNKYRNGQPMTDVTFSNWNFAPQTSAATFSASLPADYEGIAILQRSAAVKAAGATPAAEPNPPTKK